MIAEMATYPCTPVFSLTFCTDPSFLVIIVHSGFEHVYSDTENRYLAVLLHSQVVVGQAREKLFAAAY